MAFFGYTVSRWVDRLRRMLANQTNSESAEPFTWDWQERSDYYATCDKYYANTIYLPQGLGGQREVILRERLKRPITDPLDGFYAPVASIVDAYQNTLRGQWGQELVLTDEAGRPLGDDRKALNEAAERLWQWSNLDTAKSVLQRWAALYGTVGLRIIADAEAGRVRMAIDHPSRIVDFDESADGNVSAVLLEYTILEGPLGADRRHIKIKELLTRDYFEMERDGVKQARQPNALGVCPYVLLRHRDVGAEWGVPAFHGSEPIIDRINWRISRQDESIDRHMFPQWFASAAGDRPTTFDLSGTQVAYVRTAAGDPTPTLQAIVAQLDQAEARGFWDRVVELMESRHPETRLSNIKAIAGQSGETIAKLLAPVESLIFEARANYEHAILRAMRIGVSWQILMGLADLGTGSGSREAAQRAYDSGAENCLLARRPALSPSVFDRIQQATADTARRTRDIADARAAEGFVSRREQLRIAGYREADIEVIRREQSEEDVIPTIAP